MKLKLKNFAYSTHYSCGQSIDILSHSASIAAKNLVKYAKKNLKDYIPVLIYSGMSGTSIATAIALELHKQFPNFLFGMAYIRKKNESSHGSPVEYSLPCYKKFKLARIFVDDCIDTGETYHYTCKEFAKSRRGINTLSRNSKKLLVNGYDNPIIK